MAAATPWKDKASKCMFETRPLKKPTLASVSRDPISMSWPVALWFPVKRLLVRGGRFCDRSVSDHVWCFGVLPHFAPKQRQGNYMRQIMIGLFSYSAPSIGQICLIEPCIGSYCKPSTGGRFFSDETQTLTHADRSDEPRTGVLLSVLDYDRLSLLLYQNWKRAAIDEVLG